MVPGSNLPTDVLRDRDWLRRTSVQRLDDELMMNFAFAIQGATASRAMGWLSQRSCGI